jgi:hypothetical protein
LLVPQEGCVALGVFPGVVLPERAAGQELLRRQVVVHRVPLVGLVQQPAALGHERQKLAGAAAGGC